MPFRQQAARIKQYLSNRGVCASISKIEDYMSPDLHYDENKTAVLEVFGMRMGHRYTELEAFIEHAQNFKRVDTMSTSYNSLFYSAIQPQSFTVLKTLNIKE